VWVYLRFTLSYRDVEDLLAERGRPMIWAHRMTFTESAGRVVLGFQIGRVMSGPRSRGTDSSWTLCWREMDSNHRFRAITSFVSRPPRTSPVAMILCVGNSDQAVKRSWSNRQRYAE